MIDTRGGIMRLTARSQTDYTGFTQTAMYLFLGPMEFS